MEGNESRLEGFEVAKLTIGEFKVLLGRKVKILRLRGERSSDWLWDRVITQSF